LLFFGRLIFLIVAFDRLIIFGDLDDRRVIVVMFAGFELYDEAPEVTFFSPDASYISL